MSVADVIKQQDEFKAHTLEITLWPKKWKAYVEPHPLKWTIVRLDKSQRTVVPESPGIYTLVVCPGIAAHPHCSCLLYVGKTNNLRNRFGDYNTTEKREIGRPKVFRMLNMYSDFVWFCFTPVPLAKIGNVEDVLITAFTPHCNDSFPADLRPVVKAFK